MESALFVATFGSLIVLNGCAAAAATHTSARPPMPATVQEILSDSLELYEQPDDAAVVVWAGKLEAVDQRLGIALLGVVAEAAVMATTAELPLRVGLAAWLNGESSKRDLKEVLEAYVKEDSCMCGTHYRARVLAYGVLQEPNPDWIVSRGGTAELTGVSCGVRSAVDYSLVSAIAYAISREPRFLLDALFRSCQAVSISCFGKARSSPIAGARSVENSPLPCREAEELMRVVVANFVRSAYQ